MPANGWRAKALYSRLLALSNLLHTIAQGERISRSHIITLWPIDDHAGL